MRDTWHSVNYPIKKVFVSRNSLVAVTLPDLDRMECFDYERQEDVSPSNVIKRDFLRAVCTECYKSPYRVFTVIKLENKIRAPLIISDYELNCNVNRETLMKHMTSPKCN